MFSVSFPILCMGNLFGMLVHVRSADGVEWALERVACVARSGLPLESAWMCLVRVTGGGLSNCCYSSYSASQGFAQSRGSPAS